jgi:hypothetical protein
MAKTYCINCIHFFDSINPKASFDGSYGEFDVCKAKDSSLNDYVRMRSIPSLINTTGACPYYEAKAVVSTSIKDDPKI